jgi:phosphoribosylaminoimidazolecarboxamide formyltransferase / IMP cyclohydrolase
MRHHPKVIGFVFKKDVKRAEASNAIDGFIRGEEYGDVFEVEPEALREDEKMEWMKEMNGIVLYSDAFFPFKGFFLTNAWLWLDNVVRAAKSGVECIAAPRGSVMDASILAEATSLGITYCFTDTRLFHH